MSYQALYRKYRPRRFAQVLGQEHITTILKNQVATGKVAHAYLFSGSRGTGKTSTAKILARAVNCQRPQQGEPCGECESCLLAQEDTVDIIELDAASNNGVDDIRAIIDKARFTPLRLKTKVYIIDEAHMLSKPAFNALLKTLEEPPAHILFILATTEPQSIPPTILSRCQRFDFHRIGIEDIVSCTRAAVEGIGAHIEEEGLLAIARAAEGGMRDALSIADQCVAFCGGTVTAADVYGVLGSMESDFLFQVADLLINCDRGGALRCLDRVIAEGRDLNVFTADLTRHFRALMMARLCGSCADVLDCTEDAMTRYQEQASRCGERRLSSATEALMEAMSGMRYLALPRVRLECAFVRITTPEEAAEQTPAVLLERVEALENRLSALRAAQAATPPQGTVPPQAAENAPAPAVKAGKREASPAGIPPQPATAPASTAPSGAGAPPASDPAALWEAVRKGMQAKAPTLAVLGLKAQCSLEGNAMVVRFPKKNVCDAFQKPENAKLALEALSTVAPDMALRFDVADAKADSMEEAAKKAFGGKIEILD